MGSDNLTTFSAGAVPNQQHQEPVVVAIQDIAFSAGADPNQQHQEPVVVAIQDAATSPEKEQRPRSYGSKPIRSSTCPELMKPLSTDLHYSQRCCVTCSTEDGACGAVTIGTYASCFCIRSESYLGEQRGYPALAWNLDLFAPTDECGCFSKFLCFKIGVAKPSRGQLWSPGLPIDTKTGSPASGNNAVVGRALEAPPGQVAMKGTPVLDCSMPEPFTTSPGMTPATGEPFYTKCLCLSCSRETACGSVTLGEYFQFCCVRSEVYLGEGRPGKCPSLTWNCNSFQPTTEAGCFHKICCCKLGLVNPCVQHDTLVVANKT